MALSGSLSSVTTSLPTNYEYYTSNGITQGLNANQSYFTLNDKLIRVYSGAMHYFRVPRTYWRDRLKKIRAAGLNAVETYVPWNLHEPESVYSTIQLVIMTISVGLNSVSATLPTNYEYYTSEGIKQGLNADQTYFTLNDKLVRIYSGAMHYFRVPRAYWRDRLKKMRAAGLNSVETVVPWNIHEPESGKYDFGNGGSEFEDFLHLEEFLNTAKEEDLFVILRTGPFISAEYNFGGFPAWLLREKTIGFRTSEPTFMKYVTRYFNVLLTFLAALQFTQGGPVIAFQVENEYGRLDDGSAFHPDKVYLEQLRQLFYSNGIVELLVTADTPLSSDIKGTLPGELLLTANLGGSVDEIMDKLEELQPGKPLMVMEYWIGWFDYWGSNHTGKSDKNVKTYLEQILARNASFNAYMFHGATNFGYNNGATIANKIGNNAGFLPITTSYDYGGALNENGAYTNKYYIIQELVAAANPIKTFVPEPPEVILPIAYNATKIQRILPFKSLLENNTPLTVSSKNVISMEKLNINNNSGQSSGYIVYRKENVDLKQNSTLTIEGYIYDTVLVLVNGELIAPKQLKYTSDLDKFGFWNVVNSSVILNSEAKKNATLDIVVENMGRMHHGKYFIYNHTHKGLWQGNVTIDNENIYDWTIIPLELKKDWINELQGWTNFIPSFVGPAIYNTILHIDGEPKDTYVDIREWGKGMVFVNGFALGRYAAIGPQRTLYLPAPFLLTGDNQLTIFEHFYTPTNGLITFADELVVEDVY